MRVPPGERACPERGTFSAQAALGGSSNRMFEQGECGESQEFKVRGDCKGGGVNDGPL